MGQPNPVYDPKVKGFKMISFPSLYSGEAASLLAFTTRSSWPGGGNASYHVGIPTRFAVVRYGGKGI